MKLNFFPKIKTERLVLRQVTALDCNEILFLRSNEIVNEFIFRPENRKTKNKNDALEFIEKITTGIKNNQLISWGICLKNSTKIIGTICLWNFSKNKKTAEVGYDLHPDFQQKGIMSEALKSVISIGFNKLNFNKIEAFTHKQNESSKKLLTKNGFKLITHRKDDDNSFNVIFEIKK